MRREILLATAKNSSLRMTILYATRPDSMEEEDE